MVAVFMTLCWWKLLPPLKDEQLGVEKSLQKKTPIKILHRSQPQTVSPYAAHASVPASAPQPCLGTATSAADTAHPEVTLEGWHNMWESGPNGLTRADITWLKEDAERGLFPRAMSYKDKHGSTRWRKVLKDNRKWFHPPEFPGVMEGKVPSEDSFFQSSVFSGVIVRRYSLRCPRSYCPACSSQKAFLYRCGYSKTVRQICHMSGWYSMLTEVLACNACRKVAKESLSSSVQLIELCSLLS
ncbi:uncharacterized protein LOC113105367 [Carassius auratus]|uniref:Uncharacterized protein LOC113105367 n=1 Tax=Carassius auratus TaxID=7957 RepID=A0A6P6PN36_CARAU|nr:uncharacterized protein LOC113105367 [Carassius auratus]